MAGILVGCGLLARSAITIEGTVEDLVPTEGWVSVKEVTAIPPEGDTRPEVDLRGALLRLRTNAGQIYIVRVQPHCVYSGDLAIETPQEGTPSEVRWIGEHLITDQETRDGQDWVLVFRRSQVWAAVAGEARPVLTHPVYSVKGDLRERGAFLESVKGGGSLAFSADTRFVDAVELAPLR